jgi:anti-sigma factor RsiW
MADAFVSAQTTPETNHDIRRHVEVCPSCRAEIDGRRRLRAALRSAFGRTSELEPSAGFAERLRAGIREEADRARPHAISRRAWLGLAAGVVAAVGLTGAVLNRSDPAADDLARDAIGDHRYCALRSGPASTAGTLSDDAAHLETDYPLLLTAPPDHVPTPGGGVRVVDRHVCAYDGRRFGHVIMQYRGHVVSLLMTAVRQGLAGGPAGDSSPHSIGRSSNGYSVVSIDAAGRSILLVGDLGRKELVDLSSIVATPLVGALRPE